MWGHWSRDGLPEKFDSDSQPFEASTMRLYELTTLVKKRDVHVCMLGYLT